MKVFIKAIMEVTHDEHYLQINLVILKSKVHSELHFRISSHSFVISIKKNEFVSEDYILKLILNVQSKSV
jgi:hypothetical protein